MSSGCSVIEFPSNRKRDEEIVDFFMKKLEFEREVKRGGMDAGELLERDLLLLNEMFYIAKRFNL